ncbi:MAG TPA: PLDc N-terminal domain-containing protein [archaeon]|nr:PLDc N-terminal domain-containing protein [archaeon]
MVLELAIIPIILLLALVNLAAFVAALIEILRAKNDSGWKILWGAVCFFLGLLGIVLYMLIGRKDLQGEKVGALKWLLIISVAAIVLFIILAIAMLFISGTASVVRA